MQYDEKWAFVGKKEKNCDPDDPDDQRQGDHWDHVGFDPEHRLVLSVVPGKRTAENVQQLVDDVQRRMEGRIPNPITTDEYPAYETAILEAYGKEVVPERTGRPGRPQNPYKVPPKNFANTARETTGRPVASADPGHGRRPDGSCLVASGVAKPPQRTTIIGHQGTF